MIKLLKTSLFLCCLIFISACSQEESLVSLDGEWRLENSTGGITGNGVDYEGEITMTIVEDDLIVFLNGMIILESGIKYQKEEGQDAIKLSVRNRQPASPFIFAITELLSFERMENSLKLTELCNCYTYYFEKV